MSQIGQRWTAYFVGVGLGAIVLRLADLAVVNKFDPLTLVIGLALVVATLVLLFHDMPNTPAK